MTALIALLLVLLAATAVLLLRRQQRRLRRASPPPLETRHLFNLRSGDIVQVGAQAWVVEDRLLYCQTGGFQWLEYVLQDGSARRWLSVCEDDALEVAWLRSADLSDLSDRSALSHGAPERLEWRGRPYRRIERGTASVRADGRVMNQRLGPCVFADYQAEAGAEGAEGLLALEWWGGAEDPGDDVEISVGERLDPRLLTFLPGDGRSVYRQG